MEITAVSEKVVTKNDSMVVRTAFFLSIFTSVEKTDLFWCEFKAKPLHKILKVFDVQRTTLREVVLIVCQGYKRAFLMKALLMRQTKRPLARSLESAADASAAREFYFFRIWGRSKTYAFGGVPGGNNVIAGHCFNLFVVIPQAAHLGDFFWARGEFHHGTQFVVHFSY